jgi:hypothetical protein
MKENNFIFLKVGKEDNIRKLYEYGELYFEKISYFQKLEGDLFRGDPDEGIWRVSQAAKTKIGAQVEDGKDQMSWIGPGEGLIGQIKMGFPDIGEIGISCFSKARLKDEMILVNENMRQLGTHAIAFYNSKIFIERIIAYAKENEFDFQLEKVEYVDRETYSGPMGIFRKFKEYELQNEIRFVIYNMRAPLTMTLGTFKGISQIIDLRNAQIIEK